MTGRQARIYRGVPRRLEKYEREPVTGEKVLCPACQGGTDVIVAKFTDEIMSIVRNVTLLYSSHALGGKKSSGRTERCPRSGMVVEDAPDLDN